MPVACLGLLALVLASVGCPRPAPPPPPPPPPPALSITTLRLPPAEVGVGYRAQLSAVGGVRPYIWSASGLPAGLALSVGGQLGGTPVAAGSGTFTVRVADSAALLQHTDDSTSAHLVLVAASDRAQLSPSQSVLQSSQSSQSSQSPAPTSPPPPPCTDTLGRRVKDAAGVPITGCGGGEIQGGLVIIIGSSAPVVSGVSPNFGPTSGGTALTISGVNFRPGATVTIGSNACLSVVVVSTNQITCITSAGTAGLVGLTVTNADGTTFLLAGAYSYQSGPVPPIAPGNPLLANNTSACGGSPLQSYCTAVFPGMIDAVDVGVGTPTFNAPTANVSKLDVHRLLPPGTFACVHFMAWFHSPGTGDHTQTKYNSNDTATVAGQMSDIESNGFQCVIIDWYSSLSTTEDGTTKKIRDNLAASGKAKFAVMEDQGAITHSGDHNCSPSDHACIITAAETDLCYMNATYFPSTAYLSIDPVSRLPVASGHPAVYTFPPSGGWSNTDWGTIRTYAQNLSANCSTVGHGSNNGPVNFIDQDNAGFTNPPWSGAFSWVSTSPYGISAQFNIDGGSGTYHESFYNNCKSHPSQICFGSAKKGFNDNGASWGLDRVVDQECGQTWVLTLRKAPTGIAGLGLQGVTWNDYEEGTELESGIVSCYGQNTATLTGSIFAWSATTSNGTYAPLSAGVPSGPQVANWTVWAVDGSGNPQAITSLPLSTLSLDLTTVCVPTGNWTMYAQLVGQPRIDNVLSNGVSYTSAGASCPAGANPTVTTVSPASGPLAGGTAVVVTGTNFRTGAGVTFNGTAATGVTVATGTTINATTPAGTGAAAVAVTNTDATTGSVAAGFNYVSTCSGNLCVTLPTGGGAVTSSPAGVTCPSTCGAAITVGVPVTLTAVAASGWTFDHWAGLCTGMGGCGFTMPSSGSVAAYFRRSQMLPADFFGATINGGYSSKFPLLGGMTLGVLGKVPGTSIRFIEPTSDCGSDPNSSCYQWGGLDNQVNYAQAHNLQVVYDLDSMPGWMCALHNVDGNCAGLPSSIAFITNFSTALATRYKGKILYYESYNEVSNQYEWADTCANLVYFHNLVYAAIKGADPAARVGAPNMAIQGFMPACTSPTSPYTGGGTMLDVSIVAQNFLATQDRNSNFPTVDALGVHLYGVRSFAGCSSGCYTLPTYGCDPANQLDCASTKVLNVYNAFRSVMTTAGLSTVPLLVTEGGFGNDTQAVGNCTTYLTACLTATQQPEYVGRWLVLLASTYADGAGALGNWYSYDVNWGTLNGTFGMNAQNASAYGQMETWLQGASFNSPCSATAALVTCQFTDAASHPGMVVFNNNAGATVNFLLPSWASGITPLLGVRTAASPGTNITVGDNPIHIQ